MQEKQGVLPQDWSWPFWPVVPLYPYGKRRTIRTEIVKDTIWTFDQIQGILYVVVPIRMSVIRLEKGGLLIYAPVAPTPECIRLVKELVAKYGDVKYIILPTISGIEHKVFVGPFARCFPTAAVFVAPKQWSFPFNLPLSWLGLPTKRTQILPKDSTKTPFTDEFDYAILGPLDLGLGRFSEVSLYHKRSRTLLVTDSVVSLPTEPPEIVQLDLYPLLFHARDSSLDFICDTPTNRRKGWQRICLFVLYFQPSVLEVKSLADTLQDALKAPDRSKKAYFGLFPFKWKKEWQESFELLRGNGRLLVAPILQELILNRKPQATLDWVDRIASWNFQRLISCHFDSPIETNPDRFRQAFNFLKDKQLLPDRDLAYIRKLDNNLVKIGITPPAQK